jgi:hypothetical protein
MSRNMMVKKVSQKRWRGWLVMAAAGFGWLLQAPAQDMVPLNIKLPAAAFLGTPTDTPVGTTVEKPSGKPRPLIMVPRGVENVALGKQVTTSDTNQLASNLSKITDGDKEASEQGTVLLRKGVQWVQIDLGAPYELYAIVIWHAHDTPKVYHGVVAQIADDPEFTKNVRTLFNDDQSNVDGLGAGENREYFETNEGKLIEAKGAVARYVRTWSKGSTESRLNEYTEVEVYGRKPAP